MPGLSASDANLEATFANLAFARLKDKAQSLLDYLVGFQMIDKNEEETHAVAVFGFKIGKEWVYAPVFYINGELKGHELLYVKNQDAFVPLTEKWVNYILNRRPKVLGESEDQPRGKLGIRQPDFDVFARAPYIGSKMASVNQHSFNYICEKMDPRFEPVMDIFTVGPRNVKYAKLAQNLTVDGALRRFGKQAMLNLFGSMRKDAAFAKAITKFYTLDQLIKAAECGVENRKTEDKRDQLTKDQQGKDETPKPRVITDGDDPDTFIDDLSDADRTKLLKDRYVVCDKRSTEQQTKLYRTQTALTINSPIKSGMYDVFVPSGEKRKVFIGMNPIRTGYNHDPMTVVMDPESKKYGTFHNSDVMTTTWYGKEELEKFVKGLPAGDSLNNGDRAMLVTPDGTCTDVFSVNNRIMIPGSGVELRIHNCCYGANGPSLMPKRHTGYDSNSSSFDQNEHVDSIVFTDKEDCSIQHLGKTLFVPKEFKALVISKGSAEDRKRNSKDYPSFGSGEDLILGSVTQAITDIKKEAAFGKSSKYHEIKVINDGLHFRTIINGQQVDGLRKEAAMKLLVEQHGFGVENAELLLKEARSSYPVEYFMKYARSFQFEGSQPHQGTFIEPTIHDDPSINSKMLYPHTTMENIGQTDNASAHEAYRNDRYIDNDAKQQAQSAAALGNKEVLDTSVIEGLVKTMDSSETVDGYIGDLLLGLDRIGRILFLYYWHVDKFKERYGAEDQIELESNLRNVFKGLGDLTIFLKQKSVEPNESGGDSEVKLDEVLSE